MSNLRELLKGPELLLAPGVYDGLSALIASKAGAKALYLSGASIAYSRFGSPDLGLVDMNEVAQIVAAIADRVDTPLIADADNGYGNALNVQRTVRTFERAGAAALQIEDQTMPKRCGHLSDKSLITQQEMAGKIRAACDARRSEHLLIVARTDAIAVEGLEAALDRAHAYCDAGADVIFVEAPRSVEEMQRVNGSLSARVPTMANMVEGGRTPVLPAAQLQEIGYRLAIFPGSAARAVARQLTDLYETLLANGDTDAFKPRMLDFKQLNGTIGTDGFLERSKAYAS